MPRKWFSGEELIKHLGSKDFELLDFIKDGLQPYHDSASPVLPPGIADIKSEIYTITRDMEEAVKTYDGFTGRSIDVKEWRRLQPKPRVQEVLGAKYYSDGSTDWIRESHENQKKNLELYHHELDKHQDLPTWKDYEFPKYPSQRKELTSIVMKYYYKREDVDLITLHVKNSGSKKRDNQQDKELAIAIARTHIEDCDKKGEVPIIADCVLRVMKRHTGRLYKYATIHGWICTEYPKESRTSGRKPGWRERRNEIRKMFPPAHHK